jgi:IstB-like ATP binding protein
VGKTHLASALGHIAVSRKHRVLSLRADQMLKKLKAARLDQTLELRKLLRVDLLIIDDLALQPLDQTETQDFYEILVERHQVSSTIVTSNREPGEWLDVMADPMLAQSAVDRLQNAAYELVVEGESYRKRQSRMDRRGGEDRKRRRRLTGRWCRRHHPHTGHAHRGWSLVAGKRVVPSWWQATTGAASGGSEVSLATF